MIVADGSAPRARIDLATAPDFDLGGIRVKPARRQLCDSAGACRDVEPRVMQVLLALARASGAVVSRDRLNDLCWEGRVVGDDSLNRCVLALRRLAREIRPEPFAIETVARVGYCLVERRPPLARGAAWRARSAGSLALAGLLLCIALGAGLFLLSRGGGGSADPPRVRLAAIRSLSPDLPPAMAASFGEELIAAFEVDDAVTTVAPGAGGAGGAAAPPDLVIGGTVQKAGEALRFTLHLRRERTGVSLWSQMFELPAGFALAPRQVAASVSQVVRCGLGGAGPSLAAMSDRQLSLWLQFCQEVWSGAPTTRERIVDAARRVTEAAPAFSRGWSSLSLFAMPIEALGARPDSAALRAEASEATERALRLDRRNSEAWATRAQGLVDRHEWAEIERLLRVALALRPSYCSCEHANYGSILTGVGRIEAAAVQYRRFHDKQPLSARSNTNLAEALFRAGRDDEAERILASALRLWPMQGDLLTLRLRRAFWTGQHDDGLALLNHSGFTASPAHKRAFAAALEALRSGDSQRRRAAAGLLAGLTRDPADNDVTVTIALAALGEDRGAIGSAARNGAWFRGALFHPGFARARHDPAFAALAARLGLVRYWRETGRHPDFCRAATPPSLCAALGDRRS